MNKEKECCEKCKCRNYTKDHQFVMGDHVCDNPSCECHHSGKEERLECGHTDEEHMEFGCGNPNFKAQKPQPVEEWEREFATLWLRTSKKVGKEELERYDQLKSFISKLLSSDRERVRAGVEMALLYLRDNQVDMRKSAERVLEETLTALTTPQQ